ncbi:MAG TPA: TetR/AcrR family transcriptional regulator [Gemmatimonadaceae bacterium]|nr:TetR/AcrR family transcriptional regulator [Gemmatimonadaceae bacterium]
MVKPAGQRAAPALEPETRDKILAAAHQVFMRQGTANARTQDIADAAGVNKALLHYYFGTKEALAREVVAEAQRQLFPRVFAILGDAARPLEQKVRDVVDFEIGFLAERPYLPGFIAAEMHTHPDRLTAMITRMGSPPVRVLQQQFDAEHAAGRIRKTDARQFVVSLLASMVFPFVMRPALEKFVLGPTGTTFARFLDQRRRTLADFFLAGLRP